MTFEQHLWLAATFGLNAAQMVLAMSPEHWCAGPGKLGLNGTRCPDDDSYGPCPPGCNAKIDRCDTCGGWVTAACVVASIAVVVVFCAGLLSPKFWEGSYSNAPRYEGSMGEDDDEEVGISTTGRTISMQYDNPFACMSEDEDTPRAEKGQADKWDEPIVLD